MIRLSTTSDRAAETLITPVTMPILKPLGQFVIMLTEKRFAFVIRTPLYDLLQACTL